VQKGTRSISREVEADTAGDVKANEEYNLTILSRIELVLSSE
jgi:hypothetical protein